MRPLHRVIRRVCSTNSRWCSEGGHFLLVLALLCKINCINNRSSSTHPLPAPHCGNNGPAPPTINGLTSGCKPVIPRAAGQSGAQSLLSFVTVLKDVPGPFQVLVFIRANLVTWLESPMFFEGPLHFSLASLQPLNPALNYEQPDWKGVCKHARADHVHPSSTCSCQWSTKQQPS